ncbi:hypothetical protein [Aliiglaciecola lipolytica]|uniref:hypothetical protein n=1 Tax=Aliiglaciecola lipolytica TaxID=477689 RepID=UPI0005905A84|nr:hypothetical protein [Aliiglaciecola lipolytica]
MTVSVKVGKSRCKTSRSLLRLNIDEHIFEKWTVFAAQRQISKKEVLESFIWEYTIKKPNIQRLLFTHSASAPLRSVWISNGVHLAADKYAKATPSLTSRIVYSALVTGLLKRKLLRLM